MTMLLIDVGNTRIKWASAALPEAAAQAPGKWLDSGSAAPSGLPQLAVRWGQLSVSRVLVSNVAGEPLRARLQAFLEANIGSQVPINWFASLPQLGALRNGYRQPTQLGCDRFAAGLGAQRLFPQQALILATCGTATTIDAVSHNGLFVGGMILPGLGLMVTSLARSTAQLPHIREHVEVTELFADNTDDAIISGCINAQVGAIERAVTRQGRQYPDDKIRCIVTGGSATLIAAYLSIEHEIVDNLVLIGLQTAAPYLSTPLC